MRGVTDVDTRGRTKGAAVFCCGEEAPGPLDDGSGHVLSVQATLPGGVQKTPFVYGMTTASGSAVHSNDLLGATGHPDKSTGSPSAAEQQTQPVNALGQVVTADARRPPGGCHPSSE